MITILLEKIKVLLIELKTNIENLPVGIDIYSTTPTKIAKWIDNSDVYRIVMPVTSENEFSLPTRWGDSAILTDFVLPSNCYELINASVIRHAQFGPIDFNMWGVREDSETHVKHPMLCSSTTYQIGNGSYLIFDYITNTEV